MGTLPVYARRTNCYMPGWSSLDRHSYVATVKVTPPRTVREPEDFDDGGTYIVHARAPAGAPSLTRALEHTMSGSNCRHEYDCCGCAFRTAVARRVSARDYVVRVSVGYNY